MTQDTEDVVALRERMIEAALILRAKGYSEHGEAADEVARLIQSLSDRIDVLSGRPTEAMIDAGVKVLRASGMVEEALEADALTLVEIYEAMTRVALHQEGIAP